MFKLYLETVPSDQEDDTLSLSSLDSYEAQEDWTEPKYRKLLFKYERGQKYYSVLESCRNAEVARDPTQATACNRELMVSREELDQRQKKGAGLLEIAKAETHFKRQRHRIIQDAVRSEREKQQLEKKEWFLSKEREMAEKAKSWSDLTKREMERLQKAFEEENFS